MRSNIIIIAFLSTVISVQSIVGQTNKSHLPAMEQNARVAEWESLRFGAFVHFNDNTFLEKEFSQNIDPKIFNPKSIEFDSMMIAFKEAGINYAVLTTRHTSGFCLWNSKETAFDVSNSAFPQDVVRMFVESCKKYQIKPCLYYCLWGNSDWNPEKWNPVIKEELKESTPKQIILGQLTELAENYGEIYEFWLDMKCWADTSLSTQEIYHHLKTKAPNTIVHFNQHVQDGTKINYFPTDILNGEERTPPADRHNPFRKVDGLTYYLPFEYELTSQRSDRRTLGNGLMKGSVWFTYPDSQFYPVDSLFKYIRVSYDRGGSNILLSTAPDKSGHYRRADRDSLIKLGRLLRNLK